MDSARHGIRSVRVRQRRRENEAGAGAGAIEPLAFLRERGQATRSQISAECFRGKVPKARIDASLEHLLVSTPPKITVQWGERADGAPGAPLRVYRLAAG